MHAREGVMSSSVFTDDLCKLYPIIEPDMSDSGCFDNVVEFLCYAGQRELPEVSCDWRPSLLTVSVINNLLSSNECNVSLPARTTQRVCVCVCVPGYHDNDTGGVAEWHWYVCLKESLLSLERIFDGAVGRTRSVYITCITEWVSGSRDLSVKHCLSLDISCCHV